MSKIDAEKGQGTDQKEEPKNTPIVITFNSPRDKDAMPLKANDQLRVEAEKALKAQPTVTNAPLKVLTGDVTVTAILNYKKGIKVMSVETKKA